MEQREIVYEHAGTALHALAFLPDTAGRAPGVLVAHDWRGRHAFSVEHARRLAERGYVGFALDMYGQAKVGTSLQENAALALPLQRDRALMMARAQAALSALKSLPEVDATRTAAVGFCFGGMCVLDLARSGAELGGVVSLHGLLAAPPPALCRPIVAKVLVLHGFKDPMAPPDQLTALGHELTNLEADWQAVAYGNAMHAFMNPEANQPSRGAVFDALTCQRAQRATDAFLEEVLGA